MQETKQGLGNIAQPAGTNRQSIANVLITFRRQTFPAWPEPEALEQVCSVPGRQVFRLEWPADQPEPERSESNRHCRFSEVRFLA